MKNAQNFSTHYYNNFKCGPNKLESYNILDLKGFLLANTLAYCAHKNVTKKQEML